MFTDIRGFTARTRRMSEAGRAKDLVQQLNAYFSEVVAAVHGEGGTVDKFIGDAALAVFGAPSTGEHARRRRRPCAPRAICSGVCVRSTRAGGPKAWSPGSR